MFKQPKLIYQFRHMLKIFVLFLDEQKNQLDYASLIFVSSKTFPEQLKAHTPEIFDGCFHQFPLRPPRADNVY